MNQEAKEDKTFYKVNFSEQKKVREVFENCQFNGCNFSYCDLSHSVFTDCTFDTCNFSLAKLNNTALNNAVFKNCKLTGLDFSKSRDLLFQVNFEKCLLDYSVFAGKRIERAKFADCSVIETDFTNADLTGVLFKNCNLDRSLFRRTNLKETDFTTSYNFSIDPENNKIAKAKFSLEGLPGLLTKYDIHIE